MRVLVAVALLWAAFWGLSLGDECPSCEVRGTRSSFEERFRGVSVPIAEVVLELVGVSLDLLFGTREFESSFSCACCYLCDQGERSRCQGDAHPSCCPTYLHETILGLTKVCLSYGVFGCTGRPDEEVLVTTVLRPDYEEKTPFPGEEELSLRYTACRRVHYQRGNRFVGELLLEVGMLSVGLVSKSLRLDASYVFRCGPTRAPGCDSQRGGPSLSAPEVVYVPWSPQGQMFRVTVTDPDGAHDVSVVIVERPVGFQVEFIEEELTQEGLVVTLRRWRRPRECRGSWF